MLPQCSYFEMRENLEVIDITANPPFSVGPKREASQSAHIGDFLLATCAKDYQWT
jgi:hypothetical protein